MARNLGRCSSRPRPSCPLGRGCRRRRQPRERVAGQEPLGGQVPVGVEVGWSGRSLSSLRSRLSWVSASRSPPPRRSAPCSVEWSLSVALVLLPLLGQRGPVQVAPPVEGPVEVRPAAPAPRRRPSSVPPPGRSRSPGRRRAQPGPPAPAAMARAVASGSAEAPPRLGQRGRALGLVAVHVEDLGQ